MSYLHFYRLAYLLIYVSPFIFSENVESLFLFKKPLAILVNFNTLESLVGVQYAEIIPVNLKQLILT